MLPTFSVNTNVLKKDKLKRIAGIIKDMDLNSYNREWAGEAFLKIVENEGPEKINLSSYAQSCIRNEKLSKAAKPEMSIITQEEFDVKKKELLNL